MKAEGLGEIPQNLIPPRWTKGAKSTAPFWQRYSPSVSSDVIEKMVHYGTLISDSSSSLYLVSRSDQAPKDVSSFFQNQKQINGLKRSAANSGTLCKPINERDDTPVSRATRLNGSHCSNEDKRRKTQGYVHSGNVEQIKSGYPNLVNAVIRIGGNSPLGMQSGPFDQGRGLLPNQHLIFDR